MLGPTRVFSTHIQLVLFFYKILFCFAIYHGLKSRLENVNDVSASESEFCTKAR